MYDMLFLSSQFQIGAVEDSYVFQLLYAQSIMTVDGKTEILVQDFDAEKKSLKASCLCSFSVLPFHTWKTIRHGSNILCIR